MKNHSSYFFCLAFAVWLSLGFAARASADLRLCNATASRVGVALGYSDGKGWTTEGWWNVASQTCEDLLKGTLNGRFYYIHAVDYDRGGEWSGDADMCTRDRKFTIRGVADCRNRGYVPAGFFEIDTGERNNWTIRLTDPEIKNQKPETRDQKSEADKQEKKP